MAEFAIPLENLSTNLSRGKPLINSVNAPFGLEPWEETPHVGVSDGRRGMSSEVIGNLSRFSLVMCAVFTQVFSAAPATLQVPIYRSDVQAVEVDVRVTDKSGRPVRGLNAADFSLRENGTEQAISTLAFVELEPSQGGRRSDVDVERDTASNDGSGRMWVMLIGGFGQKARLAARRFVEDAVGPRDEVAVVLVHQPMNDAQGFTRSRARLLHAVERIGESPANIGLNQLSVGYRVLEDLCIRLGAFRGRRKSVVYFDPPPYFQPPPNAPPDQVVPYFEQLDAVRAATRNNVTVYTVSTLGAATDLGNAFAIATPTGQTPLQQIGGLRLLAEETGGDAIVNSNDFGSGFERFVRESNAYYVLGYVPAAGQSDGAFRAIEVRVNRPDVTVRARRGYYAERPGGPTSAPRVRPEASIQEALRLPIAVAGIATQVFAAPFRRSDGSADLLLGAQLSGSDLRLEDGETLEIGYQAMTNEGRVIPGSLRQVPLDLSDAARRAAETSGVRLLERMVLPAGRYQLRFAVRQPNGRTGMVVADADIPDFAETPLSLSGLVLTSPLAERQLTVSGDTAAEGRVPLRPLAARTFSTRDIISMYAEIYTNATTPISTTRVTVTLRALSSKMTREVPTTVSHSDARTAAVTVRLSLHDLHAGEYVLTLEARAGRRASSRSVALTIA